MGFGEFRCRDKKNAKFMVETTSWEGESGSTTAGNGYGGLDPEGLISHILQGEKGKSGV